MGDAAQACTNVREHKPRVLIIGAGMSGMLMGIRLKQAGIYSFEILEKAATLGGTWRDNRYPGLQCDVPAYMYTYSFEPNPDCSRKYAPGPELQAYFERVFVKYGLASYTRFGTEVESATWEDGAWTVVTKDGATRRAEVVVAATGVLHHPSYPDLPGLESFAGVAMHSARWRQDVSVERKRVGVIGTGSTAVQIVGAIADSVSHLDVFQRTPHWIVPTIDTEYGAWRKPVLRRFPVIAQKLGVMYAELTELTLGNIGSAKWVSPVMERLARRNLEASIPDPALREKLTPDYAACCKRIIFNDNFYQALLKPNVDLVTEGIERVEPEGLRTRDGALHPMDVLVFATGFKLCYAWPIRFSGRDGRTLDDLWDQGAYAYRSLTVPSFPNLFFMQGPHSPVGNFSLIAVAEVQAEYVMQLIERMRRGELASVEPREAATASYNRELREAVKGTVWASGCKSWYLDKSGVPALWPFSFKRYREELRRPNWADFVTT